MDYNINPDHEDINSIIESADQLLPDEIKKFKWDLDSDSDSAESEYNPSSSSSESDNVSEISIVKATTKRGRSQDPRAIIVGCNTSKSGILAPSTEYCYLNNFHNFWRWLSVNYYNTLNYSPPIKSPKKIKELKDVDDPPIKIKLITPKIFFEYIGTNDRSKYSQSAFMVQQGLKYVFKEFDMEEAYIKLMTSIRKEEISKSNARVFDRSRFIKVGDPPAAVAPAPPPAKRSSVTDAVPKLIDDDIDTDSHPIIDETTRKILYLKYIAYHQWEHLEAMTPGLQHTP